LPSGLGISWVGVSQPELTRFNTLIRRTPKKFPVKVVRIFAINHDAMIPIPKNRIASGMIVGLTLEHSRWRLKMTKTDFAI